jgi:hypothetical protein
LIAQTFAFVFSKIVNSAHLCLDICAFGFPIIIIVVVIVIIINHHHPHHHHPQPFMPRLGLSDDDLTAEKANGNFVLFSIILSYFIQIR